jgi:lipopolysaccharide export system protein LptA
MRKSDKVQLTFIYGLAIILGAVTFVYGNSTINAIQVEKPAQVRELETGNITASGRNMTVYQTQGGNRQTIQVTATNAITPQPATASIQGDQEDGDNLQPALGYGALNWTLQ